MTPRARRASARCSSSSRCPRAARTPPRARRRPPPRATRTTSRPRSVGVASPASARAARRRTRRRARAPRARGGRRDAAPGRGPRTTRRARDDCEVRGGARSSSGITRHSCATTQLCFRRRERPRTPRRRLEAPGAHRPPRPRPRRPRASASSPPSPATTARLEWAPPADGGAPVESTSWKRRTRERKKRDARSIVRGSAPRRRRRTGSSSPTPPKISEDLSSRLSWRRAAVVRNVARDAAGLRPNVSARLPRRGDQRGGRVALLRPERAASTDPAAPSPPGRPRVAARGCRRAETPLALAWTPPAETHGRVRWTRTCSRRAGAPRGGGGGFAGTGGVVVEKRLGLGRAPRAARSRHRRGVASPGGGRRARLVRDHRARRDARARVEFRRGARGSSRSPRGRRSGAEAGHGLGPGLVLVPSSDGPRLRRRRRARPRLGLVLVLGVLRLRAVARRFGRGSPRAPLAPLGAAVLARHARLGEGGVGASRTAKRRRNRRVLAQTRDSSDEKGGGGKKKWRTVARVDLTGDPGTPGGPPPRGKEKAKGSFGGGGGGGRARGAARDWSARVAGLRSGAACVRVSRSSACLRPDERRGGGGGGGG